MENVIVKAEIKPKYIRRNSPRLQTVFPNPEELELVKNMAEKHSNISFFLRLAAIEKAKQLENTRS